MMPAPLSLRKLRESLPPAKIQEALLSLSNEQALATFYDWEFWARPSQLPPAEFSSGQKTYWLIEAGRGFGKTRCGAEQVRAWIKQGFRYVNLIGATLDDARDIMIQGESGILAICPRSERPRYVDRELRWPNGAKSLVFTADEPERLRGKQHDKLWADEVAAWRYAESWDQAQFGLRIGTRPQAVVTTTPRPTPLVRELRSHPDCVVTKGTTYENRENLAAEFFKSVVKKYEGTRLGRQELNAELLDDNPGALWHRVNIDTQRAARAPEAMERIVVGVDPAVTSREDSDETGIVAVGRAYCDKDLKPTKDQHFFVLADRSLIASPDVWAKASVKAYADFTADRIIGEQNNGGEMVELTIRTADPNVSYRGVTASRGKVIRAEPVAALYEQGRVHHVGFFPQLEDQLCDWDPLTSPRSPDRLDALVWAVTELCESFEGEGIFTYYRKLAEAQSAGKTAPQHSSSVRTQAGFTA